MIYARSAAEKGRGANCLGKTHAADKNILKDHKPTKILIFLPFYVENVLWQARIKNLHNIKISWKAAEYIHTYTGNVSEIAGYDVNDHQLPCPGGSLWCTSSPDNMSGADLLPGNRNIRQPRDFQ